MKRLILSQLILCLSGMALFSQQPEKNWELSTTESGTKEYIARDYIKLKPGFTYKAIGDDTFTAKIDEYLVFPPNNATYGGPDGTIGSTPSSGGVVGSIPGSFNVSPTGAATYTIPIEVPAGINGMQPNISLVYNSQAGNGIAGWGWNIGGISMISRVPKSFYYDGEVSGIDWTKDSPLALDGQRLIKISETEYRTENESFSKITAKNIQDWGPEVITVTTKEGMTIEYGSSEDIYSYNPLRSGGRLPINLGWSIVKMSDPFGNMIRFKYTGSSITQTPIRGTPTTTYQDARLDYIEYGSEDNLYGRVNFSYDDREDILEGFIGGSLSENSKILASFEVKINDEPLKKYSLIYEHDGHYSQLTEVGLENSAGEKFNATRFEWSKSEFPIEEPSEMHFERSPLMQQLINAGYSLWSFNSRTVGDINGDGLLDVVIKVSYKKGTAYDYVWAVYRNTGSSFEYVYDSWWDAGHENSFFFVDIEKSGKDKLYVFRTRTKVPNGFIHGKVLTCYGYNRNNNFGELGSFRSAASRTSIDPYLRIDSWPEEAIAVIPGDYIGDGNIRLAIFGNNNKLLTFTGLESTSGPSYTFDSEFGGDAYSQLHLTNITGTGKQEFLYTNNDRAHLYEIEIATGSIWQISNKFSGVRGINLTRFDKIFPGDFNGDGNTDILAFDKDYKWNLYKSNGAILGYPEYLNDQIKDLIDVDNLLAVDINEDGKTDLVSTKTIWNGNIANTALLNVLICNGNEFNLELSQEHSLSEVSSLRGFGKFLNATTNSISTWGFGKINCITISPDIKFNKIERITDAYTNDILITYKKQKKNLPVSSILTPLESNVNNEKDQAAVFFIQDYYVVNETKGELIDLKYEFLNPAFHYSGKGFLGFRTTSVKNNLSNTKKTNTYSLNTDFYILIPDTTKTKTNEKTSWTSHDYSLREGLKPNQFITRLNSVTEKNGFTNTTIVKTFNDYDEYENPKIIITDYGGGWKETQKLTYTAKGSWCANRISTLETTFENPEEDPITLKKGYDYNDKGKLIKESANIGTPDVIFTEYLNYDSFGNPRKIKTTAKGDVREVEMTYLEGRFQHTEKNVQLKETTTYNYDLTKGLIKSKADPLGTTSYKYDGFGRLTEVTYPDKIKTAIARQWSGNSSPNEPKYYVFEETSGQGPVKTWYDGLGREVRRDYNGLGNELSITTKYDNKGRLYQVSEPHTGSSPSIWAVTYGYDEYGRKETVTTPADTTSYSYLGLKTTATSPTGKSETTLNSAGKVVESMVNEKRVSFKYYPTGQKSKAIPEGGPAVEFEYNLLGNRTLLKDPNAGTITSEYNGFGQILKNTQRIHTSPGDSITSYKYFANGLIEEINVHGQITKYEYDSKNRIEKIEIAGVHKQSFMYDSNNRPTKITETIDGSKTYDFKTEYDAYGRVKKEVYPSGFYVSNEYDENGFLINVTDSKDQKIWEAVEANVKGQLTRYRQGGHETVVDYHDIWGLPNTIVSEDNINMSYYFTEKGNLDYREDRLISGSIQKEEFDYDAANRLTDYDLSFKGTVKQSNTIIYDPLTGGIKNKSDVGFLMEYGKNTPFHALSQVAGLPESIKAPQAITYSNINKVKSITQGDKQHQITYGVHQQRIKGIFKTGRTTTLTKYYLGNYEEEVASGNTRKLHYIYGGNGLAAIMEHKNGQENLFYIFSDYQGNLLAVTNTSGTFHERYAYDPWGARRNPTDWTQPDTRSSLKFSRGYTMHEHLDDFGLINMNGRVYDPLMAQFFSPDPHIQSPENWYNYNRYAYCLNNPLVYTDPSGELIWIIPNIGWSKSGGLSIGISVVVGIPGGLSAQAGIGYSFGSNDAYGYVGATAAMNTVYASYSLNSGGSVGYTAGLSPFSGLPISTNFGTVGVNYNISHNSWSGNVSSWQVDQSGWTFNPSVSAMLFPEQTTNLVRGGKFINNDAMLKTFTDAGNYQGAIDYFGFKGTYDPGNKIFNEGSEPGAVDPKTGDIYYNRTAFNGAFDKLYFVADHEGRHSADVRSGKYDNLTLTKQIMAGEEFNTWAYNYRRQGLYREHGYDIGNRLNSYGTVAGINPDIIFSYSYYQPWWHGIYRIPRRW